MAGLGGGITDNGTNSDGRSTFEPVGFKGAGKFGCTDSVTSSGPYIYGEIVGFKAGGQFSASDGIDTHILNEVCIFRAAANLYPLSPDPPVVYTETPGFKGGGKLLSMENLQLIEPVGFKAAARFLLTDLYIPLPGGTNSEFIGVNAAGKFGATDTVISVDAPGVRVAGKFSASENVVINEVVGFKAGVTFVNSAVQVFTEAGGFKAGGKFAQLENTVVNEKPGFKVAAKFNTISDAQTFADSPDVKAGGHMAPGDAAVTVDSPKVKGAAKIANSSPQVSTDTAGMKAGGGFGRSTDTSVTFDLTGVSGAGKLSVTTQRTIVEQVGFSGAGKAGGTSAAVTVDTPGFKAAARASATANRAGTGIIPRLRAIVKATLSEVLSVPEGLPDAILLKKIVPPFVCIIAEQSQSARLAVNDMSTSLVIRLIYCRQDVRDGQTDTMQDIVRQAVDTLIGAVLADWTLEGNAIGLELEETPLDRVQEYQQHFSDNSQGISVGVCSFKILVGLATA